MPHKPLIYSILKPREAFVGVPQPINLDEKFGVHFTNPKSHERFDEYDPIIIVGGTSANFWKKHGIEAGTEELVRIEREVFNALKEGKMVCLIFEIDRLIAKILKRSKIGYSSWEEPDVDLTTHQADFYDLIKGFGSTKNSFSGEVDKIISKTGKGGTAGFSIKVRKGNLLYIPCNMVIDDFHDIAVLGEFLSCLLDSLKKFQLRIQYEAPKWVNNFHFAKEEPIVTEIINLQKKVEAKQERLKIYSRLKEVLWLRDDDLIEPVINMLNSLGMNTKRDEQFKEDFWLLEENKEIIIVEVKGLDSNLKRNHISQLDGHRSIREKSDAFPALMIVNSFNTAESLKEKDKTISPTEINKATHLNVLIVRTLDLCNAFSLIENGNLTSKKLFELLKTENGWLNITATDYKVLKC